MVPLAAIQAVPIAVIAWYRYSAIVTLRSKIGEEVPETIYADVQNITHKYDTEYGTTYHLKARKTDGTTKDVEVKCKGGNVNKYTRIRI